MSKRIRHLFRNLFRKEAVERGLDEELQSSLELLAEEKMREGFSPPEARRRAYIELGGVEQVKEGVRASRLGRGIEDIGRDLRYGIWMLAKKPGFTLVALLVLGLGIGANTAIFSIINAYLFRPLPVRAPGELVSIYSYRKDARNPKPWLGPVAYSDYMAFRDQAQVFAGLASFGLTRVPLSADGQREVVEGQMVSGNFFDVLGVKPSLGRGFLPEDDFTPSAAPVTVISHSLWKRRFYSAPDIIGKSIRLNEHSFTIVGVAPPEFKGLWMPGMSMQLWIPSSMIGLVDRTGNLQDQHAYTVQLIGRLQPGVSLNQAAAVIETKARQIALEFPSTYGNRFVQLLPTSGIRVIAAPDADFLPKWISIALMFVVAIVLMIAGTNLTGLLMARGITRRKEIAVRLAVGAGKFRIVRQLLTESLLLSTLGAVAGLMLAQLLVELFMSYVPIRIEGVELSLDVPIDFRVLLFTFVVCIGTGLMVGLVPSLRASRTSLVSALAAESIVVPQRERRRLRHWIIIPQIALSVALLLAASLFVGTLVKADMIDPGFDTQHQAIVVPEYLTTNKHTQQQGRAFYNRLLEGARALPGVTQASLVSSLPLSMSSSLIPSVLTERELAEGQPGRVVKTTHISPGYFQTMAIPVLRGRDFTSRDVQGNPLVVIVSEKVAQSCWPGEEAVGKRLVIKHPQTQVFDVVGVAGDVRDSISDQRNMSIIYLPFDQNYHSGMQLVARCSADPSTLLGPLTSLVHEVDGNVEVQVAKTMADSVALMFFPLRMSAAILIVCGLLGLFLALVGLYGVVSFSVANRTREIGIRAALGARKNDLIRMVIAEALRVLLIGSALGLLLIFAARPLIARLTFDLTTLDPLTFIGIPLLIGMIVLLACYIPARRAARVDPMDALREL
ncbi:MAG: ABC transporter permease [Acidobacteriia bacterium]|nr:ABC transporter permease [Terriglobia bacterium]